FTNDKNELELAYQTSWGVSTRLIGAVIMVHGDDEGLVLPPYVAPTQVVIIPIAANDQVTETANKLKVDLEARGIRVALDDSKKSPGWKFAEYEMKGVPLRIEVGPRDLEQGNVQVVFRHTREKSLLAVEDVVDFVEPAMAKMHEDMYQAALNH